MIGLVFVALFSFHTSPVQARNLPKGLSANHTAELVTVGGGGSGTGGTCVGYIHTFLYSEPYQMFTFHTHPVHLIIHAVNLRVNPKIKNPKGRSPLHFLNSLEKKQKSN